MRMSKDLPVHGNLGHGGSGAAIGFVYKCPRLRSCKLKGSLISCPFQGSLAGTVFQAATFAGSNFFVVIVAPFDMTVEGSDEQSADAPMHC